MPENGTIVTAPDDAEMERIRNIAMIDKMQEDSMMKSCKLLKIKNYDHVVIYILLGLFFSTAVLFAVGVWK